MKPSLTGPRVAALEKELAEFWRHVEEQGTPLIEPIEDEPGWHLVTFLWRDKGDGRTVIILSGPGHWDAREDVMRRLPGSDVWFRTYRLRSDWRGSYRFLPTDSPRDLQHVDDWSKYSDRFQPDPLNPRKLVWPRDPDDPEDRDEVLSVVELPDAPPQLWFKPRPATPAGSVEEHRVRSELGNERRVWVYTPPGYTASGEPYGLALLFDGAVWARMMPIAPTLDNLLADGKTPPLVAVMVGSVNRSVELPCHQPFVDFLVRELVPWVQERWHVTNDPARVIAAGQSYGGLAAAFVALRSPQTIGNVLGQSTSCWWKDETDFDMEAEWLTQEFVRSPRVPIRRFYLEAGLMETGHHAILQGNRHFRHILELKGYDVTYREYNGGHDYLCWRGGLADGLIVLTADWPAEPDRGAVTSSRPGAAEAVRLSVEPCQGEATLP